jgi:hypothetical protein
VPLVLLNSFFFLKKKFCLVCENFFYEEPLEGMAPLGPIPVGK